MTPSGFLRARHHQSGRRSRGTRTPLNLPVTRVRLLGRAVPGLWPGCPPLSACGRPARGLRRSPGTRWKATSLPMLLLKQRAQTG
ncbi:hypothetical protein NDU88_000542 [Pleurodeles waltl]|uniref:Uncharacterized protein n=1 Tax=Pleurodeles waltl TaxID=8319 RepID=A0AAV7MKU1_PLEWA|nr:hypothetical protein NDU88_000542 [Pleurodeles waltl]